MANVGSVCQTLNTDVPDLANVLLLHCTYTNNHRHGNITKLTRYKQAVQRSWNYHFGHCSEKNLCRLALMSTNTRADAVTRSEMHTCWEWEWIQCDSAVKSLWGSDRNTGRQVRAEPSAHQSLCKTDGEPLNTHALMQTHQVWLLAQSHPFMCTATLDNTEPKQMPTDPPTRLSEEFYPQHPPHFLSLAVLWWYAAQRQRQPAPTSPSPIHYRLHLLASDTDSSIHGGSTATLSTQLCQDGKWFNCLLATKHN